jgi:hypothetical protein
LREKFFELSAGDLNGFPRKFELFSGLGHSSLWGKENFEIATATKH